MNVPPRHHDHGTSHTADVTCRVFLVAVCGLRRKSTALGGHMVAGNSAARGGEIVRRCWDEVYLAAVVSGRDFGDFGQDFGTGCRRRFASCRR